MAAVSTTRTHPAQASSSSAISHITPAITPKEKYEKNRMLIEKAFQEKGFHLDASIPSTSSSHLATPIERSDTTPTAIGASGTLATAGTTYVVTQKFFQEEIPQKFITRGESPTQLSAKGKWLLGAGMIGTVALGWMTFCYREKATLIRQQTFAALQGIVDDTIDLPRLTDLTNRGFETKSGTIFEQIFEYYNPETAGHLLLARGIVRDSNSQHQQELAQADYAQALRCDISRELKNRIHFAYARSLILARSPIAAVESQGNQIEEGSIYRRLYNIYHQGATNPNGVSAVLDEGGVPFDFLCPITQEVFVNPAFYEINGHRYFFEHSSISQWIQTHQSCPITREPLTLDALQPAPSLLTTIQKWRENKLK